MKISAKVHEQNLHHPALLKAVFLLSEEFLCNLSADTYHEYSWQPYELLDKKPCGSSPHNELFGAIDI